MLRVSPEFGKISSSPDDSQTYWNSLGRIMDPSLSESAGRVAIELIRRPNLKFLYTLNGSRYARYLGIWEPRSENDWGTVRAHPSVMEFAKPLVEAIDISIQDDEVLSYCTHVLLKSMPPRSAIKSHQDLAKEKQIEKRKIVNLAGNSVVTCVNAVTNEVEFIRLSPGEGYDLSITDSLTTSPVHSIRTIGNLPRVSLMFSELQTSNQNTFI